MGVSAPRGGAIHTGAPQPEEEQKQSYCQHIVHPVGCHTVLAVMLTRMHLPLPCAWEQTILAQELLSSSTLSLNIQPPVVLFIRGAEATDQLFIAGSSATGSDEGPLHCPPIRNSSVLMSSARHAA